MLASSHPVCVKERESELRLSIKINMKKAEKALSQSRTLSATAAHSGDISPDSDASSVPHPQIYTARVLWALNDKISLIIYLP